MIEYRDGRSGVEPGRLAGFFEGWAYPPSPEVLSSLLRSAAASRIAVEPRTGRVAGFVYAISDGILAAYIPLLEVRPAFRGRGIGSELVRQVLAALPSLYMVDLCCDPELESFYRPLGFTRGCAMLRRDYAHQDGHGSKPEFRPG